MERALHRVTRGLSSVSGLAIELVSLGRTIVVEASGELDMATWPVLLAHVTEPPYPRRERIVFDLSGISFVDSEGLRGLLVVRDQLLRDGTAVELAAPSRAVERVTRILRVELRATPLPEDRAVSVRRSISA